MPRLLLRYAVVVVFALFFATTSAAQDTIKVGILHSLSGTMAISETTLKDTMLFLIEEQNKKGGLLGKQLEAVVVDPASDWPLFAEKARELIVADNVAAVFGGWTSVSRKSMLPVFKELNSILFYPAQYEGEESERNVLYTGPTPNQQAIPAVDYLMENESVERWVLAGTDYVYPQTTNKILEQYLKDKGVAAEDIMINYTPFGHSDWQTIVSDIKAFGSAGKKTAVVSTINGDANVPFYKELANQGISAEDIPVVAFSVGEEELAGFDTSPLVGHLAAWNYFQSVDTPLNNAFIEGFESYTGNKSLIVDNSVEATVVGFNLWVQAVEKAGTTDTDAVLDAIIGLETPNLTGGIAKMLPNHHITKPVLIGEIQKDGQFTILSATEAVPGDPWSDYLEESRDIIADWTGAIDCGNYDVATKTCGADQGPIVKTDPNLVWMLFATTRGVQSREGALQLDAQRMPLSYGHVWVRVPEGHEFGRLERFQPNLLDAIFGSDAVDAKHFRIKEVRSFSEEEFIAKIRSSSKRDALVFVHGYNNDFEASVFRLAQLVWDGGYRGLPILFSWSSQAEEGGYVYDQDSAAFAGPGLRDVLETIRSDTQVENIDIVAHSMGGQVVVAALSTLPSTYQVDEVVFAAPDVDRDLFIQAMPSVVAKAKGVTIYASSRDVALWGAGVIRGSAPRAGDVRDSMPAITREHGFPIDTIDVSALGTEFLGLNHDTFADSLSAVDDLARLIMRGERPPSDRTPIIRSFPNDNAPMFWRFPN